MKNKFSQNVSLSNRSTNPSISLVQANRKFKSKFSQSYALMKRDDNMVSPG
ncbi:hypothetical protein SAMN05660469_1369 [Fructobacillus pseudoficulneus]|nr:hypothetical protein SAMN05660469_1369 [Fructobacillus pseudoficulneus]